MRILFVVHQFYPEYAGGTEKVTFQLAKAAQRSGHFVRILTCRMLQPPPPTNNLLFDDVYHGIPITAFHRSCLSDDVDIDLPVDEKIRDAVVPLLEQERYDIAHVMHPMRMGSVLDAIIAFRLPYLLTITDFFFQCYRVNLIDVRREICLGAQAGRKCAESCGIPPWTSKTLEARSARFRKILHCAQERVCPSDYVREKFVNEYQDLEFRVIEHGIDFNALSALKERSRRTSASNRNEETKTDVAQVQELVFGFIGSFVIEKGIENLIEAFAKIPFSNVRLDLYGGFFGNEEYQKKISALVSTDSRVSLKSFLNFDELYSVLIQLDVLCIPSVVPETFSLILREAAVAGTPAFVSDLGAPARFVLEHGCGRVLKAGDADGWAEAMGNLLQNPENLKIWQDKLPLPSRIEEEAFFYQSLYRRVIT